MGVRLGDRIPVLRHQEVEDHVHLFDVVGGVGGPSAVRSHALGIGVIIVSWFIRIQCREYTVEGEAHRVVATFV